MDPRKYPREKIWTHKTPTRKNLDLRNTHEKKSWTHEIPPRKKILTHEMPTRKNFGLTKYPPEEFLDPRRYGGTMARDPRDPRWHETHGI